SIECRSIQNSVRVPYYHHDLAPIAFIKCNKDLVKGMSGSLLFDGPEKDAKAVMTLTHIVNPRLDDDQAPVSFYGIATNMACIPTALNSELPETCDFDPSQRQSLKQLIFGKAIDKSYEQSLELFEEYIQEEGSMIRWQKVEIDQFDQLHGIYSSYYQDKILNLETQKMNDDQRPKYFQSLSPYFGVCVEEAFTDVRAKPHTVPELFHQIIKTEDGTLDVQLDLLRHPGQIYHNDTDGIYVLNFTEDPERLEWHEDRDFWANFHHSVLIPPCD
ncbi:MAG: hypothetical protein HRT44_13880, partial [Bdellovibrionales bacterium]|nr:hypothetical protein [Bdellovibrionales bacterium]NQZ20326.1 hypothetical protein [Bdellovibrionales bacterium]